MSSAQWQILWGLLLSFAIALVLSILFILLKWFFLVLSNRSPISFVFELRQFWHRNSSVQRLRERERVVKEMASLFIRINTLMAFATTKTDSKNVGKIEIQSFKMRFIEHDSRATLTAAKNQKKKKKKNQLTCYFSFFVLYNIILKERNTRIVTAASPFRPIKATNYIFLF